VTSGWSATKTSKICEPTATARTTTTILTTTNDPGVRWRRINREWKRFRLTCSHRKTDHSSAPHNTPSTLHVHHHHRPPHHHLHSNRTTHQQSTNLPPPAQHITTITTTHLHHYTSPPPPHQTSPSPHLTTTTLPSIKTTILHLLTTIQYQQHHNWNQTAEDTDLAVRSYENRWLRMECMGR